MNNMLCKQNFFKTVLFSFLLCIGFINTDIKASVYSSQREVSSVKDILQQESLRIIDLSGPILLLYKILYKIYPEFLLSGNEKILCSLLMAFYVGYENYKIMKTEANGLKYAPSLLYKSKLEKIAIDCKMDPKLINFYYAFLNENTAVASLNMVAIDPILCHDFSRDPEAIKLIQSINPALMTEDQKEKIKKIKNIFNSDAQAFALRRELGHVFSNDSYKKLALIIMTVATVIYVGLKATFYSSELLGIFSILVGMAAAGLTDLMIVFFFNILRFMQEKNADCFAAKFSSLKEIEAVVHYFENYEKIFETEIPDSLLNRILTGSYGGKIRVKYLRDFIKSKKQLI